MDLKCYLFYKSYRFFKNKFCDGGGKIRKVWNETTVMSKCMYLRFPLAHGYFHGEFGAIERLNSLRALTLLLC